MLGAWAGRSSLAGESDAEVPGLSGEDVCLESGFGFGRGRLRSLRVLFFLPMDEKNPPAFLPLSGPDEVDREGVVLIDRLLEL
jgi:hypothetical protein